MIFKLPKFERDQQFFWGAACPSNINIYWNVNFTEILSFTEILIFTETLTFTEILIF